MPTLSHVLNEDGTFTILADGLPIRSALTQSEVEEVMRDLSYLTDEEDRFLAA